MLCTYPATPTLTRDLTPRLPYPQVLNRLGNVIIKVIIKESRMQITSSTFTGSTRTEIVNWMNIFADDLVFSLNSRIRDCRVLPIAVLLTTSSQFQAQSVITTNPKYRF